MLEFVSEKYGKIIAYWEYKTHKQGLAHEHWEWTIYMKMPVHLYDFVDYQAAGKHTTHYSDGRVEEGYHDEVIGSVIHTETRNWRLDFDRDFVPTEEDIVKAIDEELQDCIDNNDGVVLFEKIVGVK